MADGDVTLVMELDLGSGPIVLVGGRAGVASEGPRPSLEEGDRTGRLGEQGSGGTMSGGHSGRVA